jgi:hypothetical protein
MNESAAKVRKHWMQLPQSVDSLREWAKAVAEKDADADPRVAEATRHADQMHSQQTQLTRRHLQERDASRGSLFAGRMPSTLRRNARRLREQINNDRADLAQIEALPIAEAAQFVIERAEQITRDRVGAEQTKAALAARARRRDRAPAHLRGSGHDLGVGRSL